jgi:hypothetical protein
MKEYTVRESEKQALPRKTKRVLRAIMYNAKKLHDTYGYSRELAISIALRENNSCGGFKLTHDTIREHAVRINGWKSYTLRVCGDKGNSNTEKVTMSPPLRIQRVSDYRLNPQGIFGGERKTLYKVHNRT